MKISNIPVTLVQAVEGIRPINPGGDPDILTEKYVRAEVKMPDAETPFRLERLADEIIAGMVRGDAKIVCWFFG